MAGPTREFWQQRFDVGDTPWDRAAPSPQLAAWLTAGDLAPCRILVPGCGTGHEVAVLAQAGFEVTAIDYAPAAVARTRERLQQVGARAAVIEADVLAWMPQTQFDAIYEQTCLCALHPDSWRAYADQIAGWLDSGGRLFALFMQALREVATQGVIEGPPYHCDINAMRALFAGPQWQWPPPPYARIAHPRGWAELALVLTRS
jgi:SAM-dependent methyltransferase